MRRVITAADVPAGGEWIVERDALWTPVARDMARERGIRIVEVAPGETPPAPPESTVCLGADHGGFALKERLKPLLAEAGLACLDIGVFDAQPADYPDLAAKVAEAVAMGQAAWGIMVDGAGIGSAIAANKVPGVRAALCYDKASARHSREHNHANVLTLGARLLTASQAEEVVRTWLATPFAGGRHQARVKRIMEVERKYLRPVSEVGE